MTETPGQRLGRDLTDLARRQRAEADVVGKRVRFAHSGDPYTRLTPGTLGTVRLVDSAGTLHVKWDDGTSLGMIPGLDGYEFIEDDPR
jgi:hypothetical protein